MQKKPDKKEQIASAVDSSQSSLQLSRGKQRFFIVSIIIFTLIIGVAVGEFFLRYRKQSIQQSDRIDDGLIEYDSLLGWKLSRNWQGQHRHYDFNVTYSTNRYGFRGEFGLRPKRAQTRYAVIGDSFTFGFGVNDKETFVHLLNMNDELESDFLNFSIPGYSTDQETLLLQEQVINYAPDQVLLVVYLGNDLFDNELPFPLQAQNPKPYFEIGSEGLILRNTPVPQIIKSAEQTRKDIDRVVFWRDFQRDGILFRHLNRFILFRVLESQFSSFQDLTPEFEVRYANAVRLFTAIIQKIQEICHERQIGLTFVVLSGKTFVEKPRAPAAQSQDYLRKKIIAHFEKNQINVIDLASFLRNHYQHRSEQLFHPNEGHLTAAGHRIVAGMLANHLRQIGMPGMSHD